MATSTLAFIGMGGMSSITVRFGNSMPNASSTPNSAPDAPMVGAREPIMADQTSCTRAAETMLASRNWM